jgi:hypothetical protein
MWSAMMDHIIFRNLFWLTCFLSITIVSCTQDDRKVERPNDILIPQDTIAVIVGEPSEFLLGNLSLNSLFQSTNKDLYVSAAQSIQGTHVFRFAYSQNGINNEDPILVLTYGRGPNEVVDVAQSSRNANGDTLIFLSKSSGKLLFIDDEGKLSEQHLATEIFTSLADCFSYNDGILAYSLDPNTSDGDLVAIRKLSDGTYRTIIPARVGTETDAAMRNRVFSCASMPDSFAFYFVGDRSIQIVNRGSFELTQVILGLDDPIDNPTKITRPQDVKGAVPHIPKMEYSNGLLMVLFNGQVVGIDTKQYKEAIAYEFYRQDGERVYPTDFTISNDVIYLRQGRNTIYRAQIPDLPIPNP